MVPCVTLIAESSVHPPGPACSRALTYHIVNAIVAFCTWRRFSA